ncbi:MAG: transporter substrate-binding domain-containing protein [Myxococcota bacterium]
MAPSASCRTAVATTRAHLATIACVLALGFVCIASRPARATAAPEASPVLVVRGDADYPPYEFLDDDGEPAGFDVDILRAVARTQGLNIDLRLGDWTSVRRSLEDGEIDMLVGMHISRERSRVITFSHPYTSIQHAIFVRSDSDIRGYRGLRNRALVVQDATIMHDMLKRGHMTDKIATTTSVGEALRQLAAGQHDAALVPQYQGLFLARELGLNNIGPVGQPLADDSGYGFAVRKDHAQLAAVLNEGLRIIKTTGEYEAISQRWFGVYDDAASGVSREMLRWAGWALTAVAFLAVVALIWSWMLRKQVRIRTRELSYELTERIRAEDAGRRLKEQLRQSQKMEAMGRLAGGMAHDFNNIITGISGHAQLLRARAERAGTEPDPSILQIVQAAESAGDLVGHLMAFARRERTRTSRLDVNVAVAGAIQLMSHSLGSDIRIDSSVRADGPMVVGDIAQLQSALLNLGLNARDAMPKGGTLTFATSIVELGADRLPPELRAGTYVRIVVSDTGEGMPAEVREHIFEPFFTTKAPGKGTGLGLAGVYGCVRAHGGHIDVHSEVGEGTEFTILLPLIRTDAKTPPPPVAEEAAPPEPSSAAGAAKS